MLLLKDINISITRVGESSAAEAHKRLQNLKQKKKKKLKMAHTLLLVIKRDMCVAGFFQIFQFF